MTRRQRVLARLRLARGEWVNGYHLTHPEIGGSEGLRRLRELRAEGYRIEERPHPERGRSSWQYRLIEEPEQTTWLDPESRPWWQS